MGKITKAVIPAAGLVRLFLPATKAMPKEMLPIVDKPVMQFVVEEAVNSGVPHILMVTGRNKNALENHFDRAVELEAKLDQQGDLRKLSRVIEATELADIHYVRQGDPLGLGHAVSKAKSFVGDEAFALLLGDEIIDPEYELLKSMIDLAEQTGTNVIALMEVSPEDISKYGIADIGQETPIGSKVEICGLIEKPSFVAAPSNLAIIGRYVLQPGVFDAIERLTPGVGGEIQLTDALMLMAKDHSIAGGVTGLIYKGKRHDTGDKLSFLKATVQMASEREDIGKEFVDWILDFFAISGEKPERKN